MAEAGLSRIQFPSSVEWLRQYLPAPVGDFLAQREQQAMRPVSGRELAGELIKSGMDVLPATFGGPMALTANRPMLTAAQRMASSGAPREAIWNKTGWFQGADKNWRFEIPDNTSKFLFDPGKTSDPKIVNEVGSVRDAFDHPELYAAYPDAGSPGLAITGRLGGSYNPNQIGVSNSEFSSAGPRSTLLHELQHGIQEAEGFSRGTSINAARQTLPEFTNNPIVEQLRDRLIHGGHELYGPEHQTLTKQFWTLENQAKGEMARDIYNRNAGEVEARAVQNRMNLTPEQRRARYPWLDYDVPIEQQIVK